MSKLKFKVCGMRDPANIRAVANLRPDYLGFIFFRRSPRYVGDDFSLPATSGICHVGVFVNESTDEIMRRLRTIGSTTAQLHGSETPEQCAELKEHGIEIIKVFSVDDQFDFEVTRHYRDVSDMFLFDTKGKLHGGNAATFNWAKLDEYDQLKPFFLSGGLTPENLDGVRALKDMNLYGLDLNSGVEVSPGVKDPAKVRRALEFRLG